MVLSEIANFAGRTLLKYDNSRVVAPPGRLRTVSSPRRPLVLVPTLMRSGTHLLIDLVLNNFPDYRRMPLYVDLDRLAFSGDGDRAIDRLIECGAYVVKTHYPQSRNTPAMQRAIQQLLAADTVVVTTTRDACDVVKSHQSFLDLHSAVCLDDLQESVQRFNDYWCSRGREAIRFDHMVNPDCHKQCVADIARQIGQEVPRRVVGPYRKNDRVRVYCAKAMTRILGKRAPVINTTIRFAQ